MSLLKISENTLSNKEIKSTLCQVETLNILGMSYKKRNNEDFKLTQEILKNYYQFICEKLEYFNFAIAHGIQSHSDTINTIIHINKKYNKRDSKKIFFMVIDKIGFTEEKYNECYEKCLKERNNINYITSQYLELTQNDFNNIIKDIESNKSLMKINKEIKDIRIIRNHKHKI